MAFRLKNQKATVYTRTISKVWTIKKEEVKFAFKTNQWVYVKSPKHKLDKLLCQVGSIQDLNYRINEEGFLEVDRFYWVTYFGKRHTDRIQIACFLAEQLELCMDKRKIQHQIQRNWGDASKDNTNRCLRPDIAAEFTQPKPKRRKVEKKPEVEGVLESIDD